MEDSDLYSCHQCGRAIPRSTLGRFNGEAIFQGDRFFDVWCGECRQGDANRLLRLPMSWAEIVQLALFVLQQRAANADERFHQREDVVEFIATKWSYLSPDKALTPAWKNTLGKTLCAHSELFESGHSLSRPGQWRLVVDSPPVPKSRIAKMKDESGQVESRRRKSSTNNDGNDGEPHSESIPKYKRKRHSSAPIDDSTFSQNDTRAQATGLKRPGITAEKERRRRRERDKTWMGALMQRLPLIKENDETALMIALLEIPKAAHTPESARLRQKLRVRNMKRQLNLPLFDIDSSVRSLFTKVLYYKDWKPVPIPDKSATNALHSNVTPSEAYATELDRYMESYRSKMSEDAKKSFRELLAGQDIQDGPFLSSYTSRMLKPFIWRDFECKPRKLRLLESIVMHPKILKCPDWELPYEYPIDYVYLRPTHIAACNALCQSLFWPGIDVSEALTYPDFTVVAVYRKLVIGCAFMTPAAYITYIAVHPEWRDGGIGSFMLYHLIQTCMGKDITLHVSATNSAMILYQRFGFKAEEFLVNFYDKYLPEDSRVCKHAFFLRLRR